MADDDITQLTYERALEELDGLISQLETGRVDLEQALICYERATKLAQHCQELLDRTEAKVSKLVLGGGGRVEERPYDLEGIDAPLPMRSPSQAERPERRELKETADNLAPLRARSAPVLFPGYEPPAPVSPRSTPPIDPDDIPF